MTVRLWRYSGALGMAMVVMSSVSADAGDWSSVLGLSVSGQYEDNPTLSTTNELETYEGRISPSWVGVYEEETYGFDFDLNGDLVRSTEQVVSPDEFRFDTSVNGDIDLDTTRLSGSVEYSRRNFANTQFNDNEIGDDSDTATTSQDASVDDFAVEARSEFDLTDRLRLFVTDRYRTVEFAGNTSVDFESNNLESGVEFILSDVLSVSPSLAYDRFDPEDSDLVETYRADVNVDYQATDTLLFDVTVGALNVEGREDISVGATVEQSFERLLLSFSANRDVTADDDGDVRTSEGLEVSGSYAVSDRLDVGANARYQDTDDQETQSIGSNFTYLASDDVSVGATLNFFIREPVAQARSREVRIDPFVSWQVSEEFSMRFNYREQLQKASGQNSARNRRALLTLSYTTPFD